MSNHNQVAHNWANQTGRARKGFNMYYDGRTIYSYGQHFPIARIVDERHGEKGVILFNAKGYSSSTAKHKSYTRRAIDFSRFSVFEVDRVTASSPSEHLSNYEGFIERAKVSLQNAKRARIHATMHTDNALNEVGDANAYSIVFGLNMPHLTIAELDAAAAAIVARAEEQRAASELARAKAERERALRGRENLLAWLQGGDIYPPHTRIPYVRVKGDQVQTTWGATVPLTEALQAWELMKTARADKVTFGGRFDDGSQFTVGGFAVSQINEIGMKIGCHYIPFKFAKLAAVRAGLEQNTCRA